MRISILTFGAIASVLTINSSFATSSTVTSKDYVDTQDALKQDLIEVSDGNWYPNWQPEATLVSSSGSEDGDVTGNQYGILDNSSIQSVYSQNWPGYAEILRQFLSDEDGENLKRYTIPNTEILAESIREVNNNAEMTCAGWPDGVQHTDENCWLWNKTSAQHLW